MLMQNESIETQVMQKNHTMAGVMTCLSYKKSFKLMIQYNKNSINMQ